MTFKAIIAAAGLAVIGLTSVAGAQIIGGDYHVQGSTKDVEVLAGEFRVTGDVDGDIEALAGEINIDANVDGDIEVIGGDININGEVRGWVEAAGGNIEIGAIVHGNVRAAAGNVDFDGHSFGNVELAGGQVHVTEFAVIDERARLAAEDVIISGTINGDVEIIAGRLTIDETAVITGTIDYEGAHQPDVADGATLAHPVTYTYRDFEFGWKHVLEELDIDIDIENPLGAIVLVFGMIGAAIFASAFLVGVLAIVIAPKGVGSVARSFRRRPALSLLLGFILIPMLPISLGILSGILAVTIIGIPLVALLWILYVPAQYLAFTLGAIAIGDLLLNRNSGTRSMGMGMRILSLFVAVIVLSALSFIPLLGLLIGFLVQCIGLGSWTLAIFDKSPADEAETRSEPAPREAVETVTEPEPEPEPDPEPEPEGDESSDDDSDSEDDNPVR
jgi:cytoskeletal protein CcmA (bactofilin family)